MYTMTLSSVKGRKKEVSGVYKKFYHLMIYWATYFTSFPIPDVCLCQGFGAVLTQTILSGQGVVSHLQS